MNAMALIIAQAGEPASGPSTRFSASQLLTGIVAIISILIKYGLGSRADKTRHERQLRLPGLISLEEPRKPRDENECKEPSAECKAEGKPFADTRDEVRVALLK